MSELGAHSRARPARISGACRTVIRLVLLTVALLIAASYGAGAMFHDALDRYTFAGEPLGDWLAKHGSLYACMFLVLAYCALAKRRAKAKARSPEG